MKKILLITLLLISSLTFAKEIIITDNGREILLKDDYTYEVLYNGTLATTAEGKQILLKKNYTWEYITAIESNFKAYNSYGRKIILKTNNKWDYDKSNNFDYQNINFIPISNSKKTKVTGSVFNGTGENYKKATFELTAKGMHNKVIISKTFTIYNFKSEEKRFFQTYLNTRTNIPKYEIKLIQSIKKNNKGDKKPYREKLKRY